MARSSVSIDRVGLEYCACMEIFSISYFTRRPVRFLRFGHIGAEEWNLVLHNSNKDPRLFRHRQCINHGRLVEISKGATNGHVDPVRAMNHLMTGFLDQAQIQQINMNH